MNTSSTNWRCSRAPKPVAIVFQHTFGRAKSPAFRPTPNELRDRANFRIRPLAQAGPTRPSYRRIGCRRGRTWSKIKFFEHKNNFDALKTSSILIVISLLHFKTTVFSPNSQWAPRYDYFLVLTNFLDFAWWTIVVFGPEIWMGFAKISGIRHQNHVVEH